MWYDPFDSVKLVNYPHIISPDSHTPADGVLLHAIRDPVVSVVPQEPWIPLPLREPFRPLIRTDDPCISVLPPREPLVQNLRRDEPHIAVRSVPFSINNMWCAARVCNGDPRDTFIPDVFL